MVFAVEGDVIQCAATHRSQKNHTILV
ncbi:MAG: hypothetical protein RI979_1296, partial [Pseudomonadota bacterium]